MRLIEWFNSNGFVILLGWFCTVGGFVYTMYIRKIKSLSSSTVEYELISQSVKNEDKLKISYNNQEIKNLKVLHWTVWNSGNASIRKSDIPDQDPIRMEFETGTLLGCEVVSAQRSNNCEVNIIEDSVSRKQVALLSFDYLDKRESVIVRIDHIGSNTESRPIGKIIGGRIVL